MKKLILVAATMLIATQVSAQTNVGLGVVAYNHNDDVDFGFQASFEFQGYYLDAAGNLGFTGGGQHLNFASNQTYKTDRHAIYSLNIGKSVPVWKFYVTPRVGIVSISDIYEDTLGFKTYFFANEKIEPNFGVSVALPTGKSYNTYVTVGTFERVGIGIKLNLGATQ